jgi:hypothetical protein
MIVFAYFHSIGNNYELKITDYDYNKLISKQFDLKDVHI